MGSAIVITSGKGGTGKTAMTCGIGSALAKSGKREIRGEEQKISTDASKVQVWVVPTNEELAIARETVELVTK